MRKVVCELSGGYDSAYSTKLTLDAGAQVTAAFVDYGQPYARQEREAAQYLASWFAARYPHFERLVNRQVTLEMGLAAGGVPVAYVPIRNLVIGTIMANLAEAVGAEEVVVGSKTTTHRDDDPFCFWDCTTEFYERMGDLVTRCSEKGVSVRFSQPLGARALPKSLLLLNLREAGVDLGSLWNCYEGGHVPCRRCHHCVLMRRDLETAGLLALYPRWDQP